MKKLTLLLLAAVLFTACQSNGDSVVQKPIVATITGQIANVSEPVLHYTYNQISDTAAIDSLGNFKIELDIEEPTFVYIKGKEEWKGARMYVQLLRKYSLNADENNNEATTVGGDDMLLNNYCLAQKRTLDTVKYYGQHFVGATDFNTFQNSLNELFTNIYYHFDTLNQNWGTEEEAFIALEQKRIQVLRTWFYLTHYNLLTRQANDVGNLQEIIEQELSKIDLTDAQLLQLDEINVLLSEIIGFELAKQSADKPIETFEDYLGAYFSVADSTFGEVMIEYIYYTNIKKFMGYYGPEKIKEYYEKFIGFAKNEHYKADLEAIFAEYKKLEPGNPSINWQFPDKDGKMHQLSDFRGKYVYIDVWATWCGPCVRETPFLKDLIKRFEGKNIQFVQISVDEDREAWLEMVKKKNVGGVQLFASKWDNDLCNFFKIGGIPCFIIIDPEGNIVSANAERPSDENIDEVLNALLEK